MSRTVGTIDRDEVGSGRRPFLMYETSDVFARVRARLDERDERREAVLQSCRHTLCHGEDGDRVTILTTSGDISIEHSICLDGEEKIKVVERYDTPKFLFHIERSTR